MMATSVFTVTVWGVQNPDDFFWTQNPNFTLPNVDLHDTPTPGWMGALRREAASDVLGTSLAKIDELITYWSTHDPAVAAKLQTARAALVDCYNRINAGGDSGLFPSYTGAVTAVEAAMAYLSGIGEAATAAALLTLIVALVAMAVLVAAGNMVNIARNCGSNGARRVGRIARHMLNGDIGLGSLTEIKGDLEGIGNCLSQGSGSGGWTAFSIQDAVNDEAGTNLFQGGWVQNTGYDDQQGGGNGGNGGGGIDLRGLANETHIAFKTANGHYICAEGGGGGEVNATRTAIGGWETFHVDNSVDSERYSFRTDNGHYLSMGSGVEAIPGDFDADESWWIEFAGDGSDGRCYLKGNNGSYLSAAGGGGGGLSCGPSSPGANETFTIVAGA